MWWPKLSLNVTSRDLGYSIASVLFGIFVVEVQRYIRQSKLQSKLDASFSTKDYVTIVASAETYSSILTSTDSSLKEIREAIKIISADYFPNPSIEVTSIASRILKSEPLTSSELLQQAKYQLSLAKENLKSKGSNQKLIYAIGLSINRIMVGDVDLWTIWVAVEDVVSGRQGYGCSCQTVESFLGDKERHRCLPNSLFRMALKQSWKTIML